MSSPAASAYPSDRADSPIVVELHAVTGPDGRGGAIDVGARLDGAHRPLVGAFDRVVARVSGPPDAIAEAEAGLPDGRARAEAIAVRLRRRGAIIQWGEPVLVASARRFLRLCRERGRSSVEMMRADPGLLAEMQIGSWFDRRWELRALRRAAISLPLLTTGVRTARRGSLRLPADIAFWTGVRQVASAREWTRLTRGYSVICYHQIRRSSGERLVVPSKRFRRQLRLLRTTGYRAISPEALLAFHTESEATLPRRSFVVTADDAFDDAVAALMEHTDLHPQIFAPTSAIGGTADWTTGEPVTTWPRLRELEDAGGGIGSHSHTHRPLPELTPDEMRSQLETSLAELERHLDDPLPVLAYPNGRHDERVRAAAARAGFRAAYTTLVGRNGAGTDPYCLRRTEIKGWDGLMAFAWKVTTGENVPPWWERRRRRGS